MKIPKKFKLFATTINIVWDSKRMDDMDAYGLTEYSKSRITLSNMDKSDEISEDRIIETFYHERTHHILEAMRKRELSEDEEFVDVFSKLLRQADESAEY